MLNVIRLTNNIFLKKFQLADLGKLILLSSSSSLSSTATTISSESIKSKSEKCSSVIYSDSRSNGVVTSQQNSAPHSQQSQRLCCHYRDENKPKTSLSSSSSLITTAAAVSDRIAGTILLTVYPVDEITINLSSEYNNDSCNSNSHSKTGSELLNENSILTYKIGGHHKQKESCEIVEMSSNSVSDVSETNYNNCDIVKTTDIAQSPSASLVSSKDCERPKLISTSTMSSSGKSCFTSSLADILKFLELVGSLKHVKRTGWVLRDVKDCESISGHMYRMSMMTFLLDGTEGLDRTKCMELALVHDLAESLVGDITPFCGISKEEKKLRELKAMEDICELIEPRGKRIYELFLEYEENETPESKFVKDLDRLDMVLQAFEYEKRDDCLLKHQEFFDSTYGKFSHPFVVKLVNEIYSQRNALTENESKEQQKEQQEHKEREHQRQQQNVFATENRNGDENVAQKKISSS